MSTENPQGGAQMTRADLAQRFERLQADIKSLQAKGGADLANLTIDEGQALTAKLDERDAVKSQLKAMPDPSTVASRIADGDSYLKTPTRRPSYGNGEVKGTGHESEVKADRIDDGDSEFEKAVQKGPFKSFAHFCHSVRAASASRHGAPTPQIVQDWFSTITRSDNAFKALYGPEVKAVTGLNELTDTEGGLLTPLQFSNDIYKRSVDEDFNILSLVKVIPVSGNTYKIRARNDKTRASGTLYGGVTAYWRSEGEQLTNVKPTYRYIDFRLEKLTVLIPATEELLSDSTAAEVEISDTAAGAMRFKINDAAFRGSGVGMPLGFLNAAAKVTVTSNNGANTTISGTDVDNMWARRCRASGQGLVWLVNQDCEPQLAQLSYSLSSANTGLSATFAYVPGGLFNNSPTPMLKGKPVYYTEFNETLGTEGDIILIDPQEIVATVKSTGISSAVSTHLRFDYDESVFKFTFRADMRPTWESSLTRFKGSNALSPIVTLETTRSS